VGSVLTAATAAAVPFTESTAYAQNHWDYEADVVVVGTGAAGCTAALLAHAASAKTIIIEKASTMGGTTAKSGGMYWIPNNFRMRERAVQDSKENCLRFMARLAYPTMYNPKAPRFGMPEFEYSLMEAYYDNAASVVDELRTLGVGDMQPGPTDYYAEATGDRYAELPEHFPLLGRSLFSSDVTGNRHPGDASRTYNEQNGGFLISQYQAAIDKNRIPVLLKHRATRLVLNKNREVIGLEATADNDRTVTFRARKGLIFATGGFTANPELCLNYLRGPIFGGCAAATNQGDFVYIGQAVGAQLANMSHAWWGPCVLESALASRTVPMAFFTMPGDSVIQVNCEGRRCGDEKRYYNDRTQVHFYWDPNRTRYPNLVQIMIYDQHCREKFGVNDTNNVIPKVGSTSPVVMTADTLDELARTIDIRLEQIAHRTGNFRLDPDFGENVKETIARFNEFANTGVDRDFHRGATTPLSPTAEKPNETMYPISSTGPYYAVLIGGGALDTKGGPKINAKAQVLDTNNKPIPGLYGAGNCIASPAGQGYFSAGATIGHAIAYGGIAGRHAAAQQVRTT
jgi:3-oxosteroid 1-dehydrogenase